MFDDLRGSDTAVNPERQPQPGDDIAMKPPRKRIIAYTTAIFGIAVVINAGFATKPLVLEQMLMFDLESRDT